MRALTFKGFLASYVKELSNSDTLNLNKLLLEASHNNARLVAPVLLYAKVCEKSDTVNKFDNGKYKEEFAKINSTGSVFELQEKLLEYGFFPPEYHKVYKSYLSVKNKMQTDNQTKALLRDKINKLIKENALSYYRVYTDLQLNSGNFGAFMKNGKLDKLSLNNCRRVLNYLER